MRVTVELLGSLRQAINNAEKPIQVEVETGATVGELMTQLGISEDMPWNAAIDGKLIYSADPLADGMTLLVFPPIAGG